MNEEKQKHVLFCGVCVCVKGVRILTASISEPANEPPGNREGGLINRNRNKNRNRNIDVLYIYKSQYKHLLNWTCVLHCIALH